jgi:transposase
VINAILWKLRTGAPWRDLPERYGPWKTAHELRRWTADGTWDRILDSAVVKDDSVGAVEWTISVDSTHVRRPGRGAARRRPRRTGEIAWFGADGYTTVAQADALARRLELRSGWRLLDAPLRKLHTG